MKFRTEISLQDSPVEIRHRQKLLALGSCFADRIGHRLLENKFSIQVNPLGITFDPLSLSRQINAALNPDPDFGLPLHFHQEKWHSLQFHSKLSHPDKETVEEAIETGLYFLGKFLRESKVLLLTFGTAWVWRNLPSGGRVANCHQLPSQQFEKELCSLDEMRESCENAFKLLFKQNSDLSVILSVSPVRHTRQGLSGNNLSKSLLRVLCAELEAKFASVHYFPAYEIVMDDLRDYRFFEADLIHPNQQAEDYIWEKFSGCFFSEKTTQLVQKWQKVQKGLMHRPQNPGSAAHLAFLEGLREKLQGLESEVELKEEIDGLDAILADLKTARS